MSTRDYMTPPTVARLLGVAHDKVLQWITSGELRAVNLAARSGGRPRYHVAQADLESFLQTRAVTPTPKPARRRKRDDVPHYV